jgi:hypothetical protein
MLVKSSTPSEEKEHYIVSFDIRNIEMISEVLGNGSLPTTSRAGDHPDVPLLSRFGLIVPGLQC